MGHTETIANEPWPEYDLAKTVDASVEIVLQVNSRIKAKIQAAAGTDARELERLAMETEIMKGVIAGKTIRKVIVVPDKLVNLIVD